MSSQLILISRESPEPLPDSIEQPWVPGTKLAAKGMTAVADGGRALAEKASHVPGAEKVSQVAKGISSGVNAIPGMKALQKGTKRGAQGVSTAYHRMEHGRSLVKGTGPEIWTFVFTVAALVGALFLMFGPFKNVFW